MNFIYIYKSLYYIGNCSNSNLEYKLQTQSRSLDEYNLMAPRSHCTQLKYTLSQMIPHNPPVFKLTFSVNR